MVKSRYGTPPPREERLHWHYVLKIIQASGVKGLAENDLADKLGVSTGSIPYQYVIRQLSTQGKIRMSLGLKDKMPMRWIQATVGPSKKKLEAEAYQEDA